MLNKLRTIPIDEFSLKVHTFWQKQWMILTSGDFNTGSFNSMTIGWGSFGIMWKKPFVQVVVRPTRYTFEFMEKYDSFTLCTLPRRYRKAYDILGTKSGREGDKIALSGITPTSSMHVSAPCYEESDLILECRKIYWQDIDPSNFLDPGISANYPDKDYHRAYFGEILDVRGSEYHHNMMR